MTRGEAQSECKITRKWTVGQTWVRCPIPIYNNCEAITKLVHSKRVTALTEGRARSRRRRRGPPRQAVTCGSWQVVDKLIGTHTLMDCESILVQCFSYSIHHLPGSLGAPKANARQGQVKSSCPAAFSQDIIHDCEHFAGPKSGLSDYEDQLCSTQRLAAADQTCHASSTTCAPDPQAWTLSTLSFLSRVILPSLPRRRYL